MYLTGTHTRTRDGRAQLQNGGRILLRSRRGAFSPLRHLPARARSTARTATVALSLVTPGFRIMTIVCALTLRMLRLKIVSAQHQSCWHDIVPMSREASDGLSLTHATEKIYVPRYLCPYTGSKFRRSSLLKINTPYMSSARVARARWVHRARCPTVRRVLLYYALAFFTVGALVQPIDGGRLMHVCAATRLLL